MADDNQGSNQGSAKSEKARLRAGDLVTYQHPDPITGGLLTGAGVVYDVADSGGVQIAPLSENLLLVDPANIVTVDVENVAP